VFSNVIFENHALYDIMWKNIVAGHRWQYGACAVHSGYLRLQIHTLRLCNSDYFSTATRVARTHLSVMLYVHCPSCLI